MLSTRLSAIAAKIPAGSRLADIGSDHALLPVSLAENGTIARGIAGEVNPGPYEAAQRQVREAGVGKLIDVRKGDGLSVLTPGEVDVISIAGMGGSLIVSILEAHPDRLEGVNRLVLQPNVGEDQVRKYFLTHNWILSSEELLEEDGKLYEVLTADKHPDAERLNEEFYRERTIGRSCQLDREWLLRLGPYLVEAGGVVFHSKWERELAKWRRIEKQLTESELPASQAKREEVRHNIAKIEEVLACTGMDRR
ncbi:tRNA (adenine(22)-N(1))-methyltransferase [Gorillibacterium timonense]|uniref:tRNA (adenine(22)-N(1))-methyltransferase n=1 Tax=Gorillibacterium timonense TaxID=1689269 RepID=UPI00292A4339|nr:tRNA (adenine(22)-N(1))-methyltransferase TrmK [Gorillibacterium timonense]